jgi:CheY-like chemotaxis protein
MRDPEPIGRPRLQRFQDLMPHRVRRILLVQSLYDSFILTEDGQLNDAIVRQFSGLNLSQNPDVIRESTGARALKQLATQRIDMIVSSIQVGDMNGAELAQKVAAVRPDIPVLVLAYNNRQLTDFMARNDSSAIDRVFLWQGDTRILLAMVKYVEDRLNVAPDTGERGVPAIIVVEDNVRFYSSFLPVIYTELFAHSRTAIAEGLNLSHKMLRTRARPKVLLCTNYEEACGYFKKYEANILGIISDIEFPREGKLDRSAGVKLIENVRAQRLDIPIILQSSIDENRKLATKLDAMFLLKGSEVLLHDLRKILVDSFGFGDFVFRLPDGGEVGRAHDLKELIECLAEVPAESIAWHGGKNHFSNWLKARTEFAMAERLRERSVTEFDSVEQVRKALIRVLSDYRRERDKVVVADFNRADYDPTLSLYRIGGGSLGGKARGLAFVNRLLNESRVGDRFPEFSIDVPDAAVVGTDVFDEFLQANGLQDWAIRCESDRQIRERFLAAPFPAETYQDLRILLRYMHHPLAVRSSGLLEDSPNQPFAGVYKTYMLPNRNSNLDHRLIQLVSAIKRVYASTFSQRAKAYLGMTPYRLEEEKMAVIVQRVVGSVRDDRFYPDFAGVGRSHNFYPTPPLQASDGVVAVAAGLGRAVVEGANCFRFSPAHPQVQVGVSSTHEILNNSQREFYAMDLTREPEGGDAEGDEMVVCGLAEAEKHGVLNAIASTYSPDNDRLTDGISRPGVRVVTFAPILKHDMFPLADLLERLLAIGEQGTSAPVEIEFAVNLAVPDGERPEFGFLQMRPLAMASEAEDTEIGHVLSSQVVCRSDTVLGNGRVGDLVDAVVVDRDSFDRSRSHQVSDDVARFNAKLQKEGRPFLLIGVGRWGSNDPLLGIPISWSDIAGARVIVESGFKDMQVTPSQGTHFFQNLTSCNVGYFTVNPEAGEGFIDWDWLSSAKVVERTEFVRWLHFDQPLVIKMSGRTGEGVILKPEAAE